MSFGISATFNMTPDKIYVAFPAMAAHTSVPYEVQSWLFENVGADNIEWGTLNGRRVGVYLEGTDAIAFMLKFRL